MANAARYDATATSLTTPSHCHGVSRWPSYVAATWTASAGMVAEQASTAAARIIVDSQPPSGPSPRISWDASTTQLRKTSTPTNST